MARHLSHQTTRITKVPLRGRKESEKGKKYGLDSSDPYASSPPLSYPRNTSPNSLPDSDGWQKLTKVARRWSPGTSSGDVAGEATVGGSGFSALGPLSDVMDLGLDKEQGPRDAIMVNPFVMTLKRARSHPKVLTPGSSTLPSSKASSSLARTAIIQVSPPNPCMVGGRVEGEIRLLLILFSNLDLLFLLWFLRGGDRAVVVLSL